MHVRSYRYPVPANATGEFLALQRRVAQLYLEAGCIRYIVLMPTQASGLWLELSYFSSLSSFEAIEAKLADSGQLEPLFSEFMRLTGLREDEVQSASYEVGLETPPSPSH